MAIKTTQIMITGLTLTHPLYAVLSDGSRLKVIAGTLPAELVCGYGSATPTAIRYLGESWPIGGATWTTSAAT